MSRPLSRNTPTHYAAPNFRRVGRHDEVLSSDMRPAEIIEKLKELRFSGGLCSPIRMDGHVRDYLVSALSASRRK